MENSRFKFRAWDDYKMIHFGLSDLHGSDIGELRADQYCECEDLTSIVSSKTIMQFTGLKDKNGKEIYEGDIVHIEYFKMAVGENLGVYETEAELTGVVEFDGLSLILQNIVGEKWQEYTGHDAGEGKCKFMYLGDVYEGSLDASYQMEIIGNIYENAELLNK
jgi:uncharacterized phage protein (TIGR01671 family)